MNDVEFSRYEDETLLRAFASLTHEIHAQRDRDRSHGDVHGPVMRITREKRDKVQAEILRRMECRS